MYISEKYTLLCVLLKFYKLQYKYGNCESNTFEKYCKSSARLFRNLKIIMNYVFQRKKGTL